VSQNPQSLSLAKVMLVLVPIALSMGMALDLYLPSVPMMAKALSVDAVDIQLTLSIYMYVFGLGQFLWGPIVDRFGRKRIMLVCIFLYIIGSGFCASSANFTAILSGRALQAFGACGMQVCIFALIRDNLEGKKLAMALTYMRAAMGIAPILAPTMGAFVGVEFGWRMNFVLLAFYGGIIFFLGKFWIKESIIKSIPIQASHIFKNYLAIFKNRQFRFYTFCILAAQSTMFGYFSLSPLLLINELGFTERQFALFFGGNALAFLITGFTAGRFIYAIGLKRSVLAAAMLLTISGIVMLSCYQIFGTTAWGFFCSNLLASMACCILLGAGNTGALSPFKEMAGMAAALIGSIEFVGGGIIGTTVVYWGSVSEIGLVTILIVMGVLSIVYGLKFSEKDIPA